MSRKKLSPSIQNDVLILCRRRCCVCFGLERDDQIKRGQIAHLDQDASNNSIENLAFLCLDHHDEFDSSTSQSKGMTVGEVKKYRDELYQHFSAWSVSGNQGHLLNFLASQISNEDIAAAVVDAASKVVFYGPALAVDVLSTPELTYSDGELLLPHLVVLDRCQSWGLLSYTTEETEMADQDEVFNTQTHIRVQLKQPICDLLVSIIKNRIATDGETNWH